MSNDVHISGNVEMQPAKNVKEERFMGMTKLQFLGAVLVLVFLTSISSTFSIALSVQQNTDRIKDIARNTVKLEQDHLALCAFKADLIRRAAESQRYLDMSEAQRIAEFGPQLGTIPESTIESSLGNQNRTLKSLEALSCEEG